MLKKLHFSERMASLRHFQQSQLMKVCFMLGWKKISCILYILTTEIDRHHSVDLTYIIDHHPRQTHTLFVRLVVRGVWQPVETVESCRGVGGVWGGV